MQVNGWWEWPPATITREIAVKNRSHNLKAIDTKLQSFFFDFIGLFFIRWLDCPLIALRSPKGQEGKL